MKTFHVTDRVRVTLARKRLVQKGEHLVRVKTPVATGHLRIWATRFVYVAVWPKTLGRKAAKAIWTAQALKAAAV